MLSSNTFPPALSSVGMLRRVLLLLGPALGMPGQLHGRGAQEGLSSCGTLLPASSLQHNGSQATPRGSGILLLPGGSKPLRSFPELSANTG